MNRLLSFFTFLVAAPGYSGAVMFTGLGDLPGGDFFSIAADVSADGSVVIGTSTRGRTGFDNEAFRWTITDGMVGLGDLPGGSSLSEGNAVSDDGTVLVGRASSASGPEAFAWTLDGGMVGLGDLPGGLFNSGAWGVSADGSVIVGAASSMEGSEAFIWTATGGMVGLGDLPDSDVFGSVAWEVSADGSVVVGTGNGGTPRAFRWTEQEGLVDLNLYGTAFDLSNDGSVIVGWGNREPDNRAFRWTSSDGFLYLGDSPDTLATAVSGDGSTIVGSGAFIWDSTHGVRALKDVLEDDWGLDLTGWTLTSAVVSADGMTFAGGGTNPNGLREAWVATIPEPSTALLLAAGLAGLAGTRRQPFQPPEETGHGRA